MLKNAVNNHDINSINDYINPATYTKVKLNSKEVNNNLFTNLDEYYFIIQYDETSKLGGYLNANWDGGVLNALPGSSTCLGVPPFILGMIGYTGGDMYLDGAVKFTAKLLQNNKGKLPPELSESDFSPDRKATIFNLYSLKDNGDTFANDLFEWFLKMIY